MNSYDDEDDFETALSCGVDYLIERAKRTPFFHLPGYMNRYWLVPYKRTDPPEEGCGPVSLRKRPIAWALQQLGIAVRIHEILRSDVGRHPHNHPWPFWSIILKGNGYIEERFDDQGNLIATKTYRPGDIIYRGANTWHKLTMIDGPVTTLFITGKKCQSWGFNVGGEVVPHWDYHPEGVDRSHDPRIM